jgi:hypothetical protein
VTDIPAVQDCEILLGIISNEKNKGAGGRGFLLLLSEALKSKENVQIKLQLSLNPGYFKCWLLLQLYCAPSMHRF